MERQPRPQSVLVIGGGASGVLMATHLLVRSGGNIAVTLVESGAIVGCGLAYGTDNPDHLLNTRVAQMSALPDQPDHFAKWLACRGRTETMQCFVDRATYGQYLNELLHPWRANAGGDRLECINATCVDLRETSGGVIAKLDDGRTLVADRAVLATGHAVPRNPAPPIVSGWGFRGPDDPYAAVAIIGTGLSMVDHVVALLGSAHQGPIVCISRRGLIPQMHAAGKPLPLCAADIPVGLAVSAFLQWLRKQVDLSCRAGGTWRDAVDGIRPHIARIWQGWSLAERARFLRHAAPFWEVHRHRMPPVSAHRIDHALATGQLTILKASFHGAEARSGRVALSLRRRGEDKLSVLTSDHVIDCRGIRRDPFTDAAPVIRGLILRGNARLDGLRLGLDTTRGAALIDQSGATSGRIFAVGPVARGALWEITAIPDIREQTWRLAGDLLSLAGDIVPARG